MRLAALSLFSFAFLMMGVVSAAEKPFSPGNDAGQPTGVELYHARALALQKKAAALGGSNAYLDLYYRSASLPNNFLEVVGPLTGTHPTFFAREVSSEAILNPSYDVTFEATRCITLKQGFWAKAGGEFTARIVPVCDESGDNARALLSTHLGNRN